MKLVKVKLFTTSHQLLTPSPVQVRFVLLRLTTTRSTSPGALLVTKVARVVAGTTTPNAKFDTGPDGTMPLSLMRLPLYMINGYLPAWKTPFTAPMEMMLLPERITFPCTLIKSLGLIKPVTSSDKSRLLVAATLITRALEMLKVPPNPANPGLMVPLLVTPLPLTEPMPPSVCGVPFAVMARIVNVPFVTRIEFAPLISVKLET